MFRFIVAAVAALSLSQAGANEVLQESPEDTWEQDAAMYILDHPDTDSTSVVAPDDESDPLKFLHFAQWRSWPWTCFAVATRTGRVTSGQSRDRAQARRIAMSRCASFANSCRLRNCR
jgi:hypothetical protein